VNASLSNLEEFSALFNNVAIGIIIVDDKGDITLCNDFAFRQFGYSKHELIGKPIETLIPSRYRHKHVKHRENYEAYNSNSRPMGSGLDLFAVRKDGGEFPVEVSLSTYLSGGKQFSIAFVSDISVRKRAEDAMLQMNAQLEELVVARTQTLKVTVAQLEVQIEEAKEKDIQLRKALEKEKELNELKSKFVSLASHEFRTPLSTILSSACLVVKYVTESDQPRREKHIDRIISSVNMLTDILNDFLSVGKIEEGRIQVRISDFHLPTLVGSVCAEMKTIARKGQTFEYQHTGGDSVALDASLLKHILINLISNAIKFSPEQAPIFLKTTVTQASLELSVKDSGVGISPEDQAHLFERFFRGANVVNIQGTGLGLHIVKKYAELLDGRIDCRSELGKGTEFIVSFKTNNSIYEANSTY
jgi:PAS domain S-box-containing protein